MDNVFARNTAVEILDPDVAQEFFEANHRSGALRAKSKTLNLGLRTPEGLLVAAIQFGTPRTSAKKREYSLELLRLSFLEGYRVVGGASKLIANFIRIFSPSDFFTYQDRSGEATDVYEQSGMKLVKKSKKKQYLVAKGRTLATAKRGEYYSIASVVQRGPDALIGTNIGEQFQPSGKRKTNIELFLDLGWHIENTAGDYVYEWVNPAYSFYTYRITATDSSKYYYGVSHLKFADATVDQCLSDGYWGSGGNKFSNWKKAHRDHLQKEILSIFPRKSSAYALERKLIGTAYADDPLCLNSAVGGKDGRTNSFGAMLAIRENNCPEHGLSLHRGESCISCSVLRSQSMRTCELHGLTIHTGDRCYKCSSASAHRSSICEIHGEAIFSGDSCKKCSAAKQFSEDNCEIHGDSLFKGGLCQKCSVQSNISLKECELHGEAKFIGDRCYRCISSSSKSWRECSIHGESAYVGEQCQKCALAKTDSMRECPIHGMSMHRGSNCWSCSSSKSIEMLYCEIHGETKHKGESCVKCISASSRTLKECAIHGETPHRGDSCDKCATAKSIELKECAVHGLTKHRGDSCYKCQAAKMVHTRNHLNKNDPQPDCSRCIEAGLVLPAQKL